MNTSSLALLFMFTITLHNIEEALWLPQWSNYTGKYHKPVERNEFYFALIVITAFAYLISALFMFFPKILFLKFLFVGYVGTMIINVFFPHFIATILLKRYAPGLITGMLINLPLNGLIIFSMHKDKIISLFEVIFSTMIVAIILLISLPLLFQIGRKLTGSKNQECESIKGNRPR